MTFATTYLIAFTLALSSCSGLNIGLGGGSAPNDTAPKTSVLHQAVFTGLNGKTASGAAIFYNGTTVGNYILRLEGVSFPVEAGLIIQVNSGSNTVSTFNLRSSSGSQNYQMTGIGTSINFSIYNT